MRGRFFIFLLFHYSTEMKFDLLNLHKKATSALDQLVEEKKKETSTKYTEQEKLKLEYSIALAAILIAFGFWSFEFIKTQTYFQIDRNNIDIILFIPVMSVTTGISFIFHLIMEGILLAGINLKGSHKFLKLLSTTIFEITLFGVFLIFVTLIFYLPGIPGYYFPDKWSSTYLGLAPYCGLVLLILLISDSHYSKREEKKTQSPKKNRLKNFFFFIVSSLAIIIYISTLLLVSAFFSDNLTSFTLSTDKLTYDINTDKYAIVTFDINSPISSNSSINNYIGGYAVDHKGVESDFILNKVTNKKYVGYLPLKNLSIGTFSISINWSILKNHSSNHRFLVCNSSKKIPCFQYDELPFDFKEGDDFLVFIPPTNLYPSNQDSISLESINTNDSEKPKSGINTSKGISIKPTNQNENL